MSMALTSPIERPTLYVQFAKDPVRKPQGNPMDPESLAQVERIVTTAAAGLRQEMAALRDSTHQEMAALRESTATAAEDIKRHTGVLVEGLRHDLQLVAEGFQLHLDRRHAEDRDFMDREFRELRALLKLSYAQLHDRVEHLEQRVRVIEQHLGLSA